jgi:hypothetical protein
MEIKKIGELDYNSFKTEFFLIQKVKDYLKKQKTSIACLIPEVWLWYEATLFDLIDENEDGVPDEKFGKKFRAIYNGIIEKRGLKNNEVSEEGFSEKFSYKKEKFLTTGALRVKSGDGKEYLVKYILLKNS